MYKKNAYLAAATLLVVCTACTSCGSKEKEDKEKKVEPPVIFRKDTSTQKNGEATRSAPIINIIDTVALKSDIIYIKDSAATSIRLSQKLAQIYGTKLAAVVKQNKLKIIGAPIAWYRTQKAPFFFEAGVAVDKKPAKLPKNVSFKTIIRDSVVIARFYGPYEQTSIAYEALNDWMKERKKKLRAPSYEVYVTDPIDKNGKPVDPYRVQTDIVFPH